MSIEIEAKVRKILKKNINFDADIYEIADDVNLSNLGMDSISTIKIIVAIEKDFNIKFADEDLIGSNFKDINSLVKYIKDKII